MACATLKRTLDFDPVHNHGRPSKRRRCTPMCVSPSSPSSLHQSPFGEVCPKLTPGKIALGLGFCQVRLRISWILHYFITFSKLNVIHNLYLCLEKMAASIREEIRRLQRRKQLNFYPGHDCSNQESSSDGAMESPGSPTTSSFATTYSQSSKEKPLFTFRQVIYLLSLMCYFCNELHNYFFILLILAFQILVYCSYLRII